MYLKLEANVSHFLSPSFTQILRLKIVITLKVKKFLVNFDTTYRPSKKYYLHEFLTKS